LDFEHFVTLAQAAGEPTIDGPFIVRIVSRMIHILCAIIIGGGLFYIRSILSPSGVDACFADRRSVWARWVGVATFLLLASGLYNFIVIMRDYKEAGEKLATSYHILFGIKFLLSLLVMFIAAILAGRTAAADRFRANMPRWLNIAWTAVIAIVIIGALLRAHHIRNPQAGEPGPADAVEAPNG
jgi:hypothetical protein